MVIHSDLVTEALWKGADKEFILTEIPNKFHFLLAKMLLLNISVNMLSKIIFKYAK